MERRQWRKSFLLSMAVLALGALGSVACLSLYCAARMRRDLSALELAFAFAAALLLFAPLVLLFFSNRRLRAQLRRLLWSEQRHRLLAEASDEVFWQYDIDEDAFTVSDNFSKLYARESARTFEAFLQNVHPDDLAQYEGLWRAFITGDNMSDSMTDIRLRRGPGEPARYAWCRMLMRSLTDSTGKRRAIVGKMTDISEEKRNTERLEIKARTDALTGLLNRAGLEEAVRARLEGRRRDPCAVVILDIDLFKQINDFFGHDVGDGALSALADFLGTHFRGTDIVGRLGGDEFMALIDGVDSPARLAPALSRLREGLSNVRVPGTGRTLSASIGAALFPLSGDSFEALYRNADIALYEAKRTGIGGYALYDDDMRRSAELAPARPPATVYAFRADTHELLFANVELRRRIPDLEIGRRCHVQFMRQDAPCDNCPATSCRILGRNRYACDFFSPYLDGWMRATVARIRWRDGGDAYLLKCREIPPPEHAEMARKAAN